MKEATVALTYDPEIEAPIYNEMFGVMVKCDKRVAMLGWAHEQAKKIFYDYARWHHDSSSIASAQTYMFLMNRMDDARNALKPVLDNWMRARYAIGLN